MKLIALKPMTLMPEMRSISDGETFDVNDDARASSLISAGLAKKLGENMQPAAEMSAQPIIETATAVPQRKRKGV